MLNFCPTYDIPIRDGAVTVTVRRLSVLERAKRDLPIAEHQQRYEELLGEYAALPEKADDDTPDQKRERRRLNIEIGQVLNLHIKPVILRSGLVEIKGAEVGGRPITVDEFLQLADADLIDEAFVACDLAARLGVEQLKNLQSLGTSSVRAAGPGENSTAANVAPTDSTESVTAASISPTT